MNKEAKGKRLVFSVDESSLKAFETLREGLDVETFGEMIREAIVLTKILINLQEQGFTQIELRNPQTKEVKYYKMNIGNKK